jgi:ABC-type transporter Mla MlaB component
LAAPISKTPSQSSKPASRQAAPSAGPGSVPSGAFSTGNFSASELAGHDTTGFPPLYEAAVLYSGNFHDAAAEVLREYLREPAGKNNLRAWLMLFDFYQLTHNRKEFDALSMLFTVKFERSPPVWAEFDESGDPQRKEKRELKDFFQMKAGADGALLSEIDRFEAFAKEMGSARIDFSKVKSILAEEAELFAIVLQRIRKAKIPLWFNSLSEFAPLLKKSINESRVESSQGYWNLMFEVYILDGRLTEYEELGLEYAVAFEMSPPAWETVTRPTGTADSARQAGGSEDQEFGATGFQMKGVLSHNSTEMLSQLAMYAASRQEVAIDMSRLLRIDFIAAGLFFEAIRAIHLAQKRVILSNLNELVAALLEVFAANKHAILMRKKAT